METPAMLDDATLLHRYASARDESAFAELVRRHVDLVYSAALRQLAGDEHLARDATQLVFIDIARKARALARHPFLTGWLYTATHHAAAKLVRTEQRRRVHESRSAAMPAALSAPTPAPSWEQLRPLLDAAMLDLGETDRAAVLLRFFENRSFADIGACLRLGEDTARKRTARALDKLHAALARRGIASTSSALATALSAHSVHAAPAGLAQTAAALALKSAASVGIIGATLALLGSIKAPMLIAAATATAVVGLLWQERTIATLRASNSDLATQHQVARTALRARRTSSAVPDSAEAFARNYLIARRPAGSAPESNSLSPVLWSALERTYAPVTRHAHLSPAQAEDFIDLLVERRKAADFAAALGRFHGTHPDTLTIYASDLLLSAAPDLDADFRRLLGADGFEYLQFFDRTTPVRRALGGFTRTTANLGTEVDDLQLDQLTRLLANAYDGRIEEFFGRRPCLIPESVTSEARAFLTPAQREKLVQLQAANAALREIEDRNRVAASRGELHLSAGSLMDYPTPASAKAAGPGPN